MELGDAIGIGKSSISEWESGKRSLAIGAITDIADVLDTSPSHLMGWTDDPAEGIAPDAPDINTLEFALYGEVRDLTDEDKEELLRMARRMRELETLRKQQANK